MRFDQGISITKKILPVLPYAVIFYVADKLAWLFHYCRGPNLLGRFLVLLQNYQLAFSDPYPSMQLMNLEAGAVTVLIIKLIVLYRKKNAKKFRPGTEYGSARWGTPQDIAPYIDRKFENNIILTKTERLTMNSRPKNPKYARNKNVLVIGGSGSGKTRFYVKPNLMQMGKKISYVVTDPKGLIYKVQRNKRCFINRSCEETLICLYLQAFSQEGGGKRGTAK